VCVSTLPKGVVVRHLRWGDATHRRCDPTVVRFAGFPVGECRPVCLRSCRFITGRQRACYRAHRGQDRPLGVRIPRAPSAKPVGTIVRAVPVIGLTVRMPAIARVGALSVTGCASPMRLKLPITSASVTYVDGFCLARTHGQSPLGSESLEAGHVPIALARPP